MAQPQHISTIFFISSHTLSNASVLEAIQAEVFLADSINIACNNAAASVAVVNDYLVVEAKEATIGVSL